MSNLSPSTSKMIEQSKFRTELTINKVNVAISKMLNDNVPVNFNSVSLQAGVSKKFLYSNSEIKQKIILLRTHPVSKLNQKTNATLNESSKDVIINRQKLRIESLNEEVLKLKNEIQIIYGKLAFYQTSK